MPELRTCEAADCEEQIRAGRLLCRTHWYALPANLRSAINSTWRNRRRDGLQAYRANVTEARAYLGQKGGR